MPLLTLRNIQLRYATTPLLDGVDFTIDKGERVCLVGRNGAGKSTLLKIIGGEIQPDDGQIEIPQGLIRSRLIQEVPDDMTGSVFDQVAAGLDAKAAILTEYHQLAQQLDNADNNTLTRFEKLQAELDANDGWQWQQQVETLLSRFQLDGDQPFSSLSGGMKRRVLLARALVRQPDILLLDEPTNHLDMDTIVWLEDFLRQSGLTLVFITHDRALMRSLATRIIELDRGHLTSWPGNYQAWLDGKAAQLHAEEKAWANFDKKLAQEEIWIRQGIKARRTRNEGRVRALQEMRRQYAERRQRQGTANLAVQDADHSGKLVIEAEHLTHSYEGQTLFSDLSLTLFRGDKLGIIGPNGCGKSTLLKVLLGKLEPQEGAVRQGTRLEIAYFDQLRHSLDENATVVANVTEGSDILTINGKPQHVMGYLQDFLFEPQRARQPVKALSGGERNRLLLAKLFTRPFNLLVMDEPTNDLDTETLELLEEQLLAFDGTLLLVSHDRDFVDNVVTRTLVFEQGQVNDYVGGYQDWLRQRPESTPQESKPVAPRKMAAEAKPQARKLSWDESRELKTLPGHIETLETQISTLQDRLSDPDFFKGPEDKVADATRQLSELERQREKAFARWDDLDQKSG